MWNLDLLRIRALLTNSTAGSALLSKTYWLIDLMQMHVSWIATVPNDSLAAELRQGIAMAVSNGGFQASLEQQQWFYLGGDPSVPIVLQVIVPGSEENMSSYRTGLVGILAALLYIHHLPQILRLTLEKIMVVEGHQDDKCALHNLWGIFVMWSMHNSTSPQETKKRSAKRKN